MEEPQRDTTAPKYNNINNFVPLKSYSSYKLAYVLKSKGYNTWPKPNHRDQYDEFIYIPFIDKLL